MKAEKEYKKGLWTQEEDRVLLEYVRVHGRGQWNRIPKVTGLKRCGKSCRLRWLNYLSPGVKHGDFSEEEEDLIIRLHNLLGNRWSLIAGRVPGRTDNQVKNHWNTHLRKKLGINNYKKRKNRVFNSSKPQSNDSHRPADDNDDDDDLNNEHLQNGQLVMDLKSDGEAELMNHHHNHEPFLLPTDDIFNLYSPELLGLLGWLPI